jgi:hypothetical protein
VGYGFEVARVAAPPIAAGVINLAPGVNGAVPYHPHDTVYGHHLSVYGYSAVAASPAFAGASVAPDPTGVRGKAFSKDGDTRTAAHDLLKKIKAAA